MRVIDVSIVPAEGIVGSLGLWRSWQKCGEILFFCFYKEISKRGIICDINPLNPELNPICYLLALLGAHHFLHVSKIGVKSLTLGY